MSFQRILVPTDFSEFAGFALDHAIGLARESGASIDIVHSAYVPNLHEVVAPPEVDRMIHDTAKRRLVALLERAQSARVTAETHLVEETPTVAIQQLASRLESDCIVMGTRGLTGLQHVVLGSTTERTLRIAPCPVLTVARAPDGVRSIHPRKILVPTDFSETAEHAAAVALGLLCEGSGDKAGEVVLLHVYARPIAAGPYAFAAKNDFAGLRHRIVEALEEAADAFTKEGLSASVRVEEARSAPVEIARVAEEEQCDWVVLGTHGRTGLSHLALGSVAERVVRAAACPTLTVKKND